MCYKYILLMNMYMDNVLNEYLYVQRGDGILWRMNVYMYYVLKECKYICIVW